MCEVRVSSQVNLLTDGAFVFGVLHHIPKWRAAFTEVARVLKPGGFLLVEEPRVGFTWREFEKGIGDSGLTPLDHRKFLLGYFRSYICQKLPNAQ